MRSIGYFTFDPAKPDSQAALTRAYGDFCVRGGHIATGCFAEDASIEGHPKWDEMVQTIEDSRLGYLVVVPSASHLGPTLHEKVKRVLDLDALSCQTVCDDAEYPDPLQNAVRAQSGPNSRSERIREGMRAKAAKGLGLGKPPFGYKIIYDGTFHVVEPEAVVVRLMYDRYATEDGGVRAVASWLNDSGHRTRRGQRWSMVTVRDILRNTAYIGTYRRFGLRLPASYEAIVDRNVYRQVQEKMQGRSPVRRNPKGEPFLLSGIIYCGHCGQRMMGVTRRQSWRRKDGQRARAEYRYYQCQSRVNRNQCEYRTVNAPELEASVLDQVKRGLADAPEQPLTEAPDTQRADEVRQEIKTRAAAVRRRYQTIVERAATGALTMAQLRAVTVEAEAAMRAKQDQLALAESGAAGVRQLAESSRDRLAYLWEDLAIGEQQEVLRTLVAKVTVKDRLPQVELASS
ncbi:MAG: recombinase family protein [Chloroflexi bacterium]|nr:recombinase family protein [Chloroflexota bacterium]